MTTDERFSDPWNQGIWGCRRGLKCKWKGLALSANGIEIGTVRPPGNAWREEHDRQCGGELVQILQPKRQGELI